MNIVFEHEIRQRAYHIWVACGMNDGDAEQHWLDAEYAVRTEADAKLSAADAIAVAASPTKRAKVKAASTKVATAKSPTPKTSASKTSASKTAASKTAASKTKMASCKTVPHRTKAASIEAVI